jgi:hypothetical protein
VQRPLLRAMWDFASAVLQPSDHILEGYRSAVGFRLGGVSALFRPLDLALGLPLRHRMAPKALWERTREKRIRMRPGIPDRLYWSVRLNCRCAPNFRGGKSKSCARAIHSVHDVVPGSVGI